MKILTKKPLNSRNINVAYDSTLIYVIKKEIKNNIAKNVFEGTNKLFPSF